MSNFKETMEAFLLSCKVAISNTLDDSEISALMAEYGYDESKLQQGNSLYQKADELFLRQKTEYSEQYAATEDLQQKHKEAVKTLVRFIKVGRVAFQGNTAVLVKLDLTGGRKRSLSGWLIQAKQFYSNTLADDAVLAGFAGFGITREKLDAGFHQVKAVEQAKLDQKKETGEAQDATLQRDRALDELNDWYGDYIAIARIALEERPQLLEKLGIMTP